MSAQLQYHTTTVRFDDLRKLRAVLACIAKKDLRTYLTYALLDPAGGGRIVATNGHRLAVAETAFQCDESVKALGRLLFRLERAMPVSATLADLDITVLGKEQLSGVLRVYKKADGKPTTIGVELATEDNVGKYPQWERIIKQADGIADARTVGVNCDYLADIQRATGRGYMGVSFGGPKDLVVLDPGIEGLQAVVMPCRL